MQGFLIKYKAEVIGAGLGAVGGFLYYYFVGCANGSCMISSSPYVSVPYGALLGYFVSGIVKR
jgi:hypothetical protein